MKALITDGSYLHTLGIVRYLGREGANISVISNNRLLAISFYSKYCKKGLLGPDPDNEEEYISFLKQVVKVNGFDILIPVGYQAIKVIARKKKELESFIRIEIADYESIKIALSKRRTYELARRLDIPYPKTIYPGTFGKVEEIAYNIQYPAVIKAPIQTGRIIDYPRNPEDLIKKYTKMCEENKFEEGSLPLIQEYIDSDIVLSFSSLYQSGKCKRIFMYKEIRSVPFKGGSSACSESFYSLEVKKYATRLLDELRWHGVAHVEFKRGLNGEIKLIEINPKFWASLDVALKAGVNFPYYLCEMARGEELEYSEEYSRNLRFHFPFSRELQHIREKPSSIPKVIIDTINPSVKSNIWLSDFKPNLIELLYGLGLLLLPKKVIEKAMSLLRNLSRQDKEHGK